MTGDSTYSLDNINPSYTNSRSQTLENNQVIIFIARLKNWLKIHPIQKETLKIKYA